MDAPMAPVVSESRLRRRVLFHETDMAGVVHFSCYFKYMEEAEHALWREAGLSIAPRGAEIGWPRVSASCEFRRPLRFEDEFEVWLRIVKISTRSIAYPCSILRDGEIVASGAMTIACVSQGPDGAMQPSSIPADVASRFRVAEGAA
jgi:YbgC/YbaW family acyl-CoA thioester hydrolase